MCGNDTDLLVMIIAQLSAATNIYIMAEVSPMKCYKLSDFYQNIKENDKKLLLAVHFLSGSDTTSAFFNKRKSKFYQMFLNGAQDLAVFIDKIYKSLDKGFHGKT